MVEHRFIRPARVALGISVVVPLMPIPSQETSSASGATLHARFKIGENRFELVLVHLGQCTLRHTA